jgi:hypothetical protein
MNDEADTLTPGETREYSNVFRPGVSFYTVGPMVDGRLRVVDADGERWIEPADKH